MAFTPTKKLQDYIVSPPPSMPEGDRRYINSQLRQIAITISSITASVREIQEHLEAEP